MPEGEEPRKGQILAAITALKQICNHPSAYQHDDRPLAGRSGKLAAPRGDRRGRVRGRRARPRVHPLRGVGPAARRAPHRAHRHTGRVLPRRPVAHRARPHDRTTSRPATVPGALVLSLKAGGTGLNLTAANHVVLYDRWWNPAVEDQARDRAWRIGQTHTVISHRLVCPGTVDERVEEVVAGKRRIADLVLPEVELAGRPRQRPAPHGARHPPRRSARRRPHVRRGPCARRGPGSAMSNSRRRKPAGPSRQPAAAPAPTRDFWGTEKPVDGDAHRHRTERPPERADRVPGAAAVPRRRGRASTTSLRSTNVPPRSPSPSRRLRD